MDSVTQIVLGSSVAIATLGRRTAVWKAALWGGIAGTLPELDAFVNHGDAILNMVLHRAESHALFYLTVLSVPMAWLVSRLHREADRFTRWWLALWLALITHPLLDWMTVYGTQLLRPFTDTPYAVGSVFIIDPLYTLPLLLGVLLALAMRQGRGIAWARAALVVSTAYLAWGVAAQQIATRQVLASAPVPHLTPEQLLVTPAPFNTVLWRAVAVTPTHYYEGYYSLLDGDRPVRWTTHVRGADLYARYRDHPLVDRVARFSHGFFKMSEAAGGDVFITDLRMGNEPTYSFHFNLGTPAEMAAGQRAATLQMQRPDLATALPWLWKRMWGADVVLAAPAPPQGRTP
ncbi:metal-dependent hydrolase [Acidovorax sp. LjRoot117]|uniref:metal-dependent hydrolase n=1 Tax=Acidovorax sp. LjRoot117 TaxID=3342255 RepID=UPI003ECD5054